MIRGLECSTIKCGPILLLTACMSAPAAVQQPELAVPDLLDESAPRAEVLLLGTFHFKDAGLDSYVPEHDIDILSADRQREVEALVDGLASFRPDRIAVEVRTNRQARLDSLYAEYRQGNHVLGSNEVYQLGFRLARLLGHERVYAIDVAGRSYFPDMTQAEYGRRVQELLEGQPETCEWDDRYTALYRFEDSVKTTLPLNRYLAYRNSADRIRKGHGHYLVCGFRLGRGDDYLGPDMRTAWYNRNLRIFHNIQRITDPPSARILVIIGAGHLPILRHAIDSSPEYELVEPADYLVGG